MAQGTYRGTYETGDPRAAAQAKAMGATIGPDGWWYKGGQRLDHNQADAMANTAGVAADNAHQQWGTGDIWDRNRNFVGNALKNAAPIAGILTGGLGGVALGGLGAALGSGIHHGTNIGDIAKTGVENGMLTSGGQNLASAFGYNGPMSAMKQAANKLAANAGTEGAAFSPSSGAKVLGGGPPDVDLAAFDKGAGVMPSLSPAPSSFTTPFNPGAAAPASASFLSKLASGATSPEVIGSLLKGIGGMAQGDAQTKYLNTQNEALAQRSRLEQQQYDAQVARAKALQPLLDALMGKAQGIVGQQGSVAPNPYLSR